MRDTKPPVEMGEETDLWLVSAILAICGIEFVDERDRSGNPAYLSSPPSPDLEAPHWHILFDPHGACTKCRCGRESCDYFSIGRPCSYCSR